MAANFNGNGNSTAAIDSGRGKLRTAPVLSTLPAAVTPTGYTLVGFGWRYPLIKRMLNLKVAFTCGVLSANETIYCLAGLIQVPNFDSALTAATAGIWFTRKPPDAAAAYYPAGLTLPWALASFTQSATAFSSTQNAHGPIDVSLDLSAAQNQLRPNGYCAILALAFTLPATADGFVGGSILAEGMPAVPDELEKQYGRVTA